MEKSFKLRKVTKSDWKILLEWRNDKITRQNSFNSELISINTHKEFIKNTLINTDRNLFILEYNEIPVGTIREDRLDKDEFELSYTISPMYRGKKIGQIMMQKWVSMANQQNLEAFFEMNRTQYPPLSSAAKGTEGAIGERTLSYASTLTGYNTPRRLDVPDVEVSRNAKAPASTGIAAKVWWDRK